MATVSGRPDLLEGYTADTAPSLMRARDVLERYRAAVAAFNAAEPNDLGTHLLDLSPQLEAVIDRLEVFDRIPAAFAAALRQLDAGYDPAAQLPGVLLRARGGERLQALTLAYLAHPDASETEAARLADGLLSGERSLADRLPPGAAATALRRLEHIDDIDGWRGSLSQYGRVATRGALAWSENRRLTDLRGRHPGAHRFLDPSDIPAPIRARAGGAYNRVVLQAARSADDAAATLRANQPLGLASRLPPGLATAGRVTGRAAGVAGITLAGADGIADLRDRDWGGAAANAASIAGGLLLVSTAGPVVMTVGATLVVGSLIYEANREEIDAAARWVGDQLSDAAEGVGDLFGL